MKTTDPYSPNARANASAKPVSSRKTDQKYQKAGILVYVASYDAIGLIVQRTQSRAGTRVSLKLTEATQKPNAAAPVREWTDDTGKFQVRATLVQVADGKVTLRKEDGKEIVVSLARLSAADKLEDLDGAEDPHAAAEEVWQQAFEASLLNVLLVLAARDCGYGVRLSVGTQRGRGCAFARNTLAST
jgi:hypothetical protein